MSVQTSCHSVAAYAHAWIRRMHAYAAAAAASHMSMHAYFTRECVVKRQGYFWKSFPFYKTETIRSGAPVSNLTKLEKAM